MNINKKEIVDACCFFCGHARVMANGKRKLESTRDARDHVCSACYAWRADTFLTITRTK